MKLAILSTIIVFLLFHEMLISQNMVLTSNDIKFKTEQEKRLFSLALENGNAISILPLLMDGYESSNVSLNEASLKIENAVGFINENFMKSKTDAKRIKLIYDYVHNEFLEVYKLENCFSSIFKDGQYNCVSASALYAEIFSRLNIPFVIKELPTHVFLVAYPETSSIFIETTSPSSGYYQYNEGFVQKYVDQLVSTKQISQKESDTSSVDNIFKRHFFENSEIDLLKLAALQYYNFGVYLSDKKNYSESLEWFKKAYVLYPSERISFILRNTLLNALANGGKVNSESLELYLLFIRFNSNDKLDFSDVDVKKIVESVSEEVLITKSDLLGFNTFHSKVKGIVKDKVLIKEIDFVYFYQLTRYFYLNGNQDSIERYSEKAYLLNPNNSYLRGMISDYIMKRVNGYMDVNSIYKLLVKSNEKYSFLIENENFNNVMVNCYLEYAFQNFNNRNGVKGEEYLLKFELLIKEKNIISPSEKFITKAYSEAGVYYYRNGNKTKASEKIKYALNYYPENYMLNEMRKQLK